MAKTVASIEASRAARTSNCVSFDMPNVYETRARNTPMTSSSHAMSELRALFVFTCRSTIEQRKDLLIGRSTRVG